MAAGLVQVLDYIHAMVRRPKQGKVGQLGLQASTWATNVCSQGKGTCKLKSVHRYIVTTSMQITRGSCCVAISTYTEVLYKCIRQTVVP